MQFLNCPRCKSHIDFDCRKAGGVKISRAEETAIVEKLLGLMVGSDNGNPDKLCPVCMILEKAEAVK